MRLRWPSGKSVAFYTIASLLMVMSLPVDAPYPCLFHGALQASRNPAVPTAAIVNEGAVAQTTGNATNQGANRGNKDTQQQKPPGQKKPGASTPKPGAKKSPSAKPNTPSQRAVPAPKQRPQPPTQSNGSTPQASQKQAPVPTPAPVPQTPVQDPSQKPAPFSPYAPYPTAKLRIQAIDGRSQQPLAGAEVVLIETEQRFTTGKDGYTEWFDAPIVRNPRYRPLVAELHGQLGVVVYKNGYRDSIHLGIRMHEGKESQTTVWMYRLTPGDGRIEPVLYQVPYHHLWLVELADRFRSKTQPGEGPERP